VGQQIAERVKHSGLLLGQQGFDRRCAFIPDLLHLRPEIFPGRARFTGALMQRLDLRLRFGHDPDNLLFLRVIQLKDLCEKISDMFGTPGECGITVFGHLRLTGRAQLFQLRQLFGGKDGFHQLWLHQLDRDRPRPRLRPELPRDFVGERP